MSDNKPFMAACASVHVAPLVSPIARKVSYGRDHMLAHGISLEDVGKIIKRFERGFLTELEMETMVLSAVFNRPLSEDDLLSIRVFIHNNL